MKVGDVNGDGKIDITDVTLLANILTGKVKPTVGQLIAADVDGNKYVDENDMKMIISYILGEITEFPAEKRVVTRLPGIVLYRVPALGVRYKMGKMTVDAVNRIFEEKGIKARL